MQHSVGLQGQAAERAGGQHGADHGQCRDPEHQADHGPAARQGAPFGPCRAWLRGKLQWVTQLGGLPSHHSAGQGTECPCMRCHCWHVPVSCRCQRRARPLAQVYTDAKQLRYGHLMIMTDQDHDGSHIKGLIMNFFHHFYPSLLQACPASCWSSSPPSSRRAHPAVHAPEAHGWPSPRCHGSTVHPADACAWLSLCHVASRPARCMCVCGWAQRHGWGADWSHAPLHHAREAARC